MKKIMIALAVAGIAAVSNAAVTQWKVSTGTTGILYDGYNNTGAAAATYSDNKQKLGNQLMYVICANTTDQTSLVSDFTSAEKGTFNLSSYATKAYAAIDENNAVVGDSAPISVSTANSGTSIGKITTANGVVFYEGDQTVGTTYNYYLATIMTVGDKDYLYVSDSSGGAANDSPTKQKALTVADQTTSQTYNGVYESGTAAAGWYGLPTTQPLDPEGVPEPTSGLLMLVGLAGLALRRKLA